MLKIALCINSQKSLPIIQKEIENCMNKISEGCVIDVFNSYKEFIDMITFNQKIYDINILSLDPRSEIVANIIIRIKNIYNNSIILFVKNNNPNVSYCLNTANCQCSDGVHNDFGQMFYGILQNVNHDDYIFIKWHGNATKIFLNNILYCEANGRYSKIITVDKTYDSNLCFSKLIAQINSANFILVHKSFFVNLQYLAKMDRWEMTLQEGYIIPISRIRMDSVREKINKINQNYI